MKKNTKLFKFLAIIVIIIIFNFGYFLFIKWQDYSSAKNAKSVSKAELKTYSSPKMNLEVRHPDTWIVAEEEDKIDINPPSKRTNSYFAISLRKDFASLDDVKKTLSPTLPTTPVQINNTTGFEYTDSDYHKITWITHSGKLYMIRVYPMVQEANKILASLKFTI